jgi:hypothetical protein
VVRVRFSAISILLLLSMSQITAAKLRKVLILKFNNVDTNVNYGYLEDSITDALREALHEQFAFQESPVDAWQKVAHDNHIYSVDFHTKTAAMNLGLLSRQDIVISGGYRIQNNPETNKATILTTVNIIDISKQKVVASFTLEGHADSRIFDSVREISERIIKEAKSVLPSKENWRQQGLEEDTERPPIFANPQFGLRALGGFYSMGFADRVEASLPGFTFLFMGDVPIVSKHLFIQSEFNYVKSAAIKSYNQLTSQLNITTSNYILAGFLGAQIHFWSSFVMRAKLGGGYVLQTSQVTNKVNTTLNNSLPFAAIGIEMGYDINSYLSLIIDVKSFAHIETERFTFLNTAGLGVNFKL